VYQPKWNHIFWVVRGDGIIHWNKKKKKWNCPVPTGGIFVKFVISVGFWKNCVLLKRQVTVIKVSAQPHVYRERLLLSQSASMYHFVASAVWMHGSADCTNIQDEPASCFVSERSQIRVCTKISYLGWDFSLYLDLCKFKNAYGGPVRRPVRLWSDANAKAWTAF